jgi:hypothetical protein
MMWSTDCAVVCIAMKAQLKSAMTCHFGGSSGKPCPQWALYGGLRVVREAGVVSEAETEWHGRWGEAQCSLSDNDQHYGQLQLRGQLHTAK